MNLPIHHNLIYYRPSKQLNVSVPYRKWYDLSQSTLKIWYWITFVFYGIQNSSYRKIGYTTSLYNDKLIFIRIRNVIKTWSHFNIQMLEHIDCIIFCWNSISMVSMNTLLQNVRPFIFYKMFYGRAYPNFWQNEIKIKVIDFSFIFIFPSPCHKQHAHEIKSSTILSKLNLQNTFFPLKIAKQIFI